MKCILPAVMLVMMCIASLDAAPQEGNSADFQRIPLIESPELQIFLLLRPEATPSDDRFSGFALVNRTDKPLSLRDASYRIDDRETFHRETGQLISSGSLGSGNNYDLLHRDIVEPNTTQPRLPPGESLRLDYSSGHAMGALGILPEDSEGHIVKAKVHLQIELNHRRISSPAEGVPIAFAWLPPDDAGITHLRQRLRQLVRGGDPASRYYSVLYALLHEPRIASVLTIDDLIVGLPAHEQHARPLRQYIDSHFPNDERLVEYTLKLIRQREWLRLREMSESTTLHDARLVPPLMQRLAEQQDLSGAAGPIAKLLSRHKDMMSKNTIGEFGRLVAERSRHFNAHPPSRPLMNWSMEAKLLALTGDASQVPRVVPYLEHREVVVDARFVSVPNNGVSTRVCDVAYNVILDLLGRDGERFTIDIGGPKRDQAQEHVSRNERIKALKVELRQK